MNYVSWGDTACFSNWLHNGQPTGPQGPSTTEDGAYFLNGATSNAALLAVNREADWKWAISSEDSGTRPPYHKNDGLSGNYFDYPTSSDSMPTTSVRRTATPTTPLRTSSTTSVFASLRFPSPPRWGF